MPSKKKKLMTEEEMLEEKEKLEKLESTRWGQ